MPTDLPESAPSPAGADDSDELAHWLGIVREAYERGGHLDLVVIGESDQSTTTCWSSCPAAGRKAAFLRWLANTVDDADEFFVPLEDP